jgi:hypothetical protein
MSVLSNFFPKIKKGAVSKRQPEKREGQPERVGLLS